jgi:hypothetical protein
VKVDGKEGNFGHRVFVVDRQGPPLQRVFLPAIRR